MENYDWEKENDLLDSMQKGKSCNGSYCQNCDFCGSCPDKPEGWWE